MTAEQEEETRIAVRCRACGSWLVSAESVAAHMGPVCAGRVRAARRPMLDVPLPLEIPGVTV